MAGFISGTKYNSNYQQTAPKRSFLKGLISKVRNFGMDYDPDVIRNSVSQSDLLKNLASGQTPEALANLFLSNASISNIINNPQKSSLSYLSRRQHFREFASNDEIENILDIICDDTIVFKNNQSKFVEISISDQTIKEDIVNHTISVFNKIYDYFGFNNHLTPWNLFRKWLIDGIIAYEIVYNDDQTEIIGFLELDPATMSQEINQTTNELTWVITPITSNSVVGGAQSQANSQKRYLTDNQVIYIPYMSIGDEFSKISYVERLIRAFNILRIEETTKIIWGVTNSSFKTQYIIPVGSVHSTRGMQTLAEAVSNYRTNVDFNWQTGELQTNGQPMLQFFKDIFIPSEGGETPTIQTLGNDGPDLGNMDDLGYFSDKLKLASKIPFSRFDRQNGMGSYSLNAEGAMIEELKFSKFISRLRMMFQEILLKPVYIQMCLSHKELINDVSFKNKICLSFYNDNLFEQSKECEILENRSNTIATLRQNLTEMDKDGNEVPYFDLDFLIQKYLGLSLDEINENKMHKERKKLEGKYSEKDIEKILAGEPKSKFKPLKKKDKEDNEEGGDSGEENEGGEGGGGGEDKDSGNDLPNPLAGL